LDYVCCCWPIRDEGRSAWVDTRLQLHWWFLGRFGWVRCLVPERVHGRGVRVQVSDGEGRGSRKAACGSEHCGGQIATVLCVWSKAAWTCARVYFACRCAIMTAASRGTTERGWSLSWSAWVCAGAVVPWPCSGGWGQLQEGARYGLMPTDRWQGSKGRATICSGACSGWRCQDKDDGMPDQDQEGGGHAQRTATVGLESSRRQGKGLGWRRRGLCGRRGLVVIRGRGTAGRRIVRASGCSAELGAARSRPW